MSKKPYQNPWQTLSSQEIYDNPWIQLEHHEVINPAGGEGIYGLVKFKNIAVGVIPIDDDMHTWLVGQHRYPLDTYSWEIPEGGSPVNEPSLEGAKRELREEVGLIADTWQPLMKLHLSNSVTDEVAQIYIATGLSPCETDHEETEDITIRRLPLSDAIEMALTGEITDAISVAGLLRVRKEYADILK